MKTQVLSALTLLAAISFTQSANAASQKELSLSDACRDTVEAAVTKKYGKDDETFSIVSTHLLYGGSVGGLHFSPVVLVKTSDEVDPRDVVVITSWTRRGSSDVVGCKVVAIESVSDGLTIDFE